MNTFLNCLRAKEEYGKMKVIAKNCSKIRGKNKKKKDMAAFGVTTYLERTPKLIIEAISAKKVKVLH